MSEPDPRHDTCHPAAWVFVKRLVHPTLMLLFAIALAGCDSGTKWRSGKYQVYWIDVSSDLTLGIDTGDGMLHARVMPQVGSVGEDSRWIVATRHPNGNKSAIEYYYFSKADDEPSKNADEIVQGPFTASEFEQKSRELSLPPLTRQF